MKKLRKWLKIQWQLIKVKIDMILHPEINEQAKNDVIDFKTKKNEN